MEVPTHLDSSTRMLAQVAVLEATRADLVKMMLDQLMKLAATIEIINES